MTNLPTAHERKQLEKLPRAKHIHYILLVILIGVASLTFLFPNVSPLLLVVMGLGICCVSISAMSLQYFQRCPRCNARMTRGQSSCAGCGLEFYASITDEHQ